VVVNRPDVEVRTLRPGYFLGGPLATAPAAEAATRP
jgi:hypothetical protein